MRCNIVIARAGADARKVFEHEAKLAAVRLVLALRLHEKDRGALPVTLNELVPDYLDAVPVDPFDGGPFRYSPEDRAVYSVGPDGIDRGVAKEMTTYLDKGGR